MIIELFIVFLLISIALIIIGNLKNYLDAPSVIIAGYTLLFILGIIIITGGLQYSSGDINVVTYNWGINTSEPLNQTVETVYESFDDEIVMGIDLNHFFGFLLSVVGILGFVHVMFNTKKWNRKDKEDEYK